MRGYCGGCNDWDDCGDCGVPWAWSNSELDGVNDCAGTLSARNNGAPIAHSPKYWVEHLYNLVINACHGLNTRQ